MAACVRRFRSPVTGPGSSLERVFGDPPQRIRLGSEDLAFQPSPVVIHMRQFAANEVRPFRGEEYRQLHLLLGANAARQPDMFGGFDLLVTGPGSSLERVFGDPPQRIRL